MNIEQLITTQSKIVPVDKEVPALHCSNPKSPQFNKIQKGEVKKMC